MDKSEEIVVEFFRGSGLGMFNTHLVKTILHADETNLELLKKSYPEIVDVVIRVREEKGYFEKIEKAYDEETKKMLDESIKNNIQMEGRSC